ncbi:YtxH domain-containing protein [Granulicella cerasi]|uniref:YtxH domain-containing protein n=1 Tax=Granulicella cerasi TaxID=741063 RepID=A0ABW1Z7K1_9BACT|nr:YtxH domain-containing protein [Granulicella cerasi]
MRHKEFWVALGIGAIAGGVAALLYAPQSGVQTRKKLKRGIEDLGDTLQDSADYLKKQADSLSKEAQKLIDYTKDQFEDAVDKGQGYIKTANKTISKLV